MPICDLHVHSIRSSCGFHTLLEIVGIMREKGIEGFALTDHGPSLGTPKSHFSVMLRRLPAIIEGVRVLKGVEASIMSPDGALDLPVWEGYPFEVVLAGLHSHDHFTNGLSEQDHTEATINAMRNNPRISLISHPYHTMYPADLDAITDVASETCTALESNNSHLLMNKADTDSLMRLLDYARAKGTLLAVNSDGHVFSEMGEFALALDAVEAFDIPPEQIVNRSLESTLAFLGLES